MSILPNTTLYGYERSDFTAKDGRQVVGYWFYLARPIRQDRGAGSAFDKVYISQAKLPGGQLPPLGSVVDILYNKYGKVASVSVAPPARK